MEIITFSSEIGLVFKNSSLASKALALLDTARIPAQLSYFKDTLRVLFVSKSDLDKVIQNKDLHQKLVKMV